MEQGLHWHQICRCCAAIPTSVIVQVSQCLPVYPGGACNKHLDNLANARLGFVGVVRMADSDDESWPKIK